MLHLKSIFIAVAFWFASFSQVVYAQKTEVDVELVLAVDVSRSMAPSELEIQRRGYATALKSPEVIKAITGGLIGKVALLYVEWSGNHSHRVIVDWTLIESAEDAISFADKLTAEFNSALRRTSISGVLDYATNALETNSYVSNRLVIDVSGDGPNNQGRPVTQARDETVARGITINGLPLMTSDGMGSQFQLDNLDVYYRTCVIGGPGSFVIPVYTWEHFPAAVRQKLVWELAGYTPLPVIKTAAHLAPNAAEDCLIGEKIWQQFRRTWEP